MTLIYKRVIYFFVFISFLLILLYFLFPVCQTHPGIQVILVFAMLLSYISIVLTLLVFYLLNKSSKDHLVLSFFAFSPLFVMSLYRYELKNKEYLSFEGVIADKFISKNHASKSIRVNNKVYSLGASKLWDVVKIGDIIKKDSCSQPEIIKQKQQM